MIDEKVLIERLAERMKMNEMFRKSIINNGIVVALGIINDLAEEHNNGFCEWRMIDEEANVYDTTCRNPHILLEGSPTDNNYEFCPYCGKEIKVADEPKEPSDTWKQQTMSRFERVE